MSQKTPTLGPPKQDLERIFERTRPLWESLRGANIFITGGTGFFGAWLTEVFAFAMAEAGMQLQVTVLSREPNRFLDLHPSVLAQKNIKWCSGGLLDFEFPKGTYTHLIHAATPASLAFQKQNPMEMFQTIQEGTRRVLQFAGESGVHDFLLTSSGAVYGSTDCGEGGFEENCKFSPSPVDVKSAYGEGKRVAELLSVMAGKQSAVLSPKIARCFAFLGPYLPLDAHYAAGNFLKSALNGQDIEIQSDGSAMRSYMYPVDLVVWLLTLLLKGRKGEAYNVGSQEAVSIRGLAYHIARATGVSVNIKGTVQPGMAAHRYLCSTKKAQSELNLRAEVGLDLAIEKTLHWHQAQLSGKSI